jgi:zinc/manganese transport system substrate-binding protein
LSGLLAQLTKTPAKAILRAAYNDPRAGDWLAERARLPVVVLPFTVGGTGQAQDLFGLYDDTIARLLALTK